MPATLDLAAADVSRRYRAADRERIRQLAQSYDRRRHLLPAMPELGDRPGNHPLAKVAPCWMETDAHTAKVLARALLRKLNRMMDQRRFYDVEGRIVLLKACLRGEIANHLDALRRGELFAE